MTATYVRTTVELEIWSDYVCPFCYLEKPVIDQLQQEFGEDLQVHWRAYELRPYPVPTLDPQGDYLRDIWARAVYPMAEDRGIPIKLPPVQPRSHRAFETAEFARALDKFNEMHTALFQAFFEQGKDLNNQGVLLGLAEQVGLNPEELKAALNSGKFKNKIAKDREIASKLGIRGVPETLIHRLGESAEEGRIFSGCQSYEILREEICRQMDALCVGAPPSSVSRGPLKSSQV